MSRLRFCRATLTRDSDQCSIPKTSRATVRRAMTQRATRPVTLATLLQVWHRSKAAFTRDLAPQRTERKTMHDDIRCLLCLTYATG